MMPAYLRCATGSDGENGEFQSAVRIAGGEDAEIVVRLDGTTGRRFSVGWLLKLRAWMGIHCHAHHRWYGTQIA